MAYVGASPHLVDFVKDIFSGTGSQSIFTMSVAPSSVANCLVIIGNGNSATVAQPNAYSISGLSLVFVTPPPAGDSNIVVLHLGQAAITAGITRLNFGSTGFTPTIPTIHDVTLSGLLSVTNGGLGNIGGIATNVSGVVATANGGTGITNPGANNNLLRSNGASWESFTRNTLNIGAWTIQETVNGRLSFINGGTVRGSIADSGLLTVSANITGQGTPSVLSYDFIIVGGGGVGGRNIGGGGGGGGVLGATTELAAGTIFPVVVGNGGTDPVSNANGGASSFLGISALGGGGGGYGGGAPRSGGCGGGGSNTFATGAFGTPGQGEAGGRGTNTTNFNPGGGGGGAGAAGGDAAAAFVDVTAISGGAGGGGGQWFVNGQFYGGGGGGASGINSSAAVRGQGGPGGNGGGGAGAGSNSATATAGTPGTGGGGGGYNQTGPAAAGGSGTVIVSYVSNVQRANGGAVTSTGTGASTRWFHTFTANGNFITN